MAAKKTAKKTVKKTASKSVAKPDVKLAPTAPVSGGEAPAAAKAISPPPPPGSNSAHLERVRMLDAVANQYNKDGHYAVVRANDAPNAYIKRRPTGIMELDIDLGGGWPAGGMCFVSGPDNAGKSWLLYLTMAMQQKIYGHDCIMAIAPTEGGFAFDQAIRCGMRVSVPDDMLFSWNQWREQRGLEQFTDQEIAAYKYQIGDLRIIRGETGEEILKITRDFAGTKACSIIAIDSIQGLQPVADAGKELDEHEKMAAHATMMGRFYKQYIPMTTGLNGVNETTLLMTQQVRQNMKKAEAPSHIAKYLPDFTVSGARSTKHYKLVDLIISNGSVIKKDVAGVGKVATGKVVKWVTEKGKAGTHDNISGEVNFSYDIPTGVDLVQTAIDSGLNRGVIQKLQNNRIALVQPDTRRVLEDYTMPNMKAFKLGMEEDTGFDLAVRREILAAAGKQCIFR
jgi:RecA/RadA recombinase